MSEGQAVDIKRLWEMVQSFDPDNYKNNELPYEGGYPDGHTQGLIAYANAQREISAQNNPPPGHYTDASFRGRNGLVREQGSHVRDSSPPVRAALLVGVLWVSWPRGFCKSVT